MQTCPCALLQCRLELSLGSSQGWAALPAWQRRLREVSFTALLPLYGALRLSVPLVDPESYSQQWLVASLLCWCVCELMPERS